MISLIVINYKKSDLTVRLCRSLAMVSGRENLKVVVVDNEATEASRRVLAEVQTLPISIDILSESTNWGYFGGARRGLEFIRERRWNPDWIIVSNSDIEFPDIEIFNKLTALSAGGEVGMVAPTILSGLSRISQNPFMVRRPSVLRMHFYKWVFRYRLTCYPYQMAGLLKSALKGMIRLRAGASAHPASALEKLTALEAASPSTSTIYAAHGSFMIFSRSFFERGGSFAHGPFLFGEEITAAETCRRLDLKVMHVPEIAVSHVEHGSMGLLPSPRMLDWQREASAYCADTFFS